MRWVGFYRRREGAPWQRACEGATLEECSRRLSEATRGMKIRSTDYLMTGGQTPPTMPAKQKARTA
jgi:hypothetical protein